MFGTDACHFFFLDAHRHSCDSYIEKHYLVTIAFWHLVFSQLEDNRSIVTIIWLLLPHPQFTEEDRVFLNVRDIHPDAVASAP